MRVKPLVALGFLASVVIAVSSYHAGNTELLDAGVGRPGFFGATRWVYLAALAVLFGCWLLIGRDALRADDPQRWQPMALVTALWSAPVLAAAPLASRDVWAYAGQADLYRHDVDPYARGPVAYAGHYLRYIDTAWRDQSSPYGPVWMVLAAAVITMAGSHVLVTVIATRVLCALGLLLIVLTLPRLARTFGGSPATAMWLCCANPVLVVVALGGPHNDLLVGGLMCLALWLVVTPGPAWRSLAVPVVVLTLATEIKLPAACALAFLPYLWLRLAPAATRWRERRHALWEVAATVLAGAAATALVIAAATGLGFGWTHQVNANSSGAIMFSLPVLASFVWTTITGPSGTDLSVAAQVHPRVAAATSALVGAALVGVWLAARRFDPARLLAIALALGVVASTTIHPWYAAWALPVAAATVTSRRVLIALTVLATWASLSVVSNGSSYLAKPPGVLIAVVAAAVIVPLLRSPRPAGAGEQRPERLRGRG